MTDDDDVISSDGESRKKLVEEFVKVTGTSEAMAQDYLEDGKWKFYSSVNDFFQDDALLNGRSPVAVGGNKVGEVSVSLAKRRRRSVSDGVVTFTSIELGIAIPPRLRFITWNIWNDVVYPRIVKRTEAVCANIKTADADIVFLQEVNKTSENIIRTKLQDYFVSSTTGNRFGHYTITMFKKASIEVLSTQQVKYSECNSKRNMLTAKVKFANMTINLINTHLESSYKFSITRVSQLKQAFEMSSKLPKEEAVIFAGDLNLRDKELEAIGGPPSGMVDAWEATGKRKECQYTWDITRNDNLDKENFGFYRPRYRFDRLFWLDTKPSRAHLVNFNLIGQQRLECNCFPSGSLGYPLRV